MQCNLVILPQAWAADFLKFCQLNPKSCPLVVLSENPGDIGLPEICQDLDIRNDLPSYRIFKDGALAEEVNDITDYWRDDQVMFALDCSFSFEEALLADGLDVCNISEGCNVPMYRTNIACKPAEAFKGDKVVSMCPFKAFDAIRTIQICSRFPAMHGASIHLGDPGLIGINDINKTDFGDSVTINENEIPLSWDWGVTPQLMLEQAKPPFCFTHSPGCILLTDMPSSKLAIM
jgi:uncharacterized protein YcsI (UPF0317 family)